jgi:hypothetical protein
MFYESDDESMTFSDFNQCQVLKHQKLLEDIEDKLYDEVELQVHNEILDENDNRYYYQQLENLMDDKEIMTWKNNFIYLRVKGYNIPVTPLQSSSVRTLVTNVSRIILSDSGEYLIVDNNTSKDVYEDEETFAIDTTDCPDHSIIQISP